MVTQWFAKLYYTVWRKHLLRSGMVTGIILTALLVGMTVAYRAHMEGNFHKLKVKANIETVQEDVASPRPGGQEAIVLTRARGAGSAAPEFLSVVALPGRGMNLLQITAYIPGKGEVNLLASPTLDKATEAMTGKGEDALGRMSMAMGGAFEAPWAGRIWGALSPGSGHVTTVWRGHAISLPVAASGDAVASDGMMLAMASTTSRSSTLPNGADAQAVYRADDFGSHWPSKTDVTVTVLLSGKTIDLTVEARNVGDAAEPIGIGWQPRFAVLDGNREQLRLHIPGEMRIETSDREKGQPTGALIPVAGTQYDFTMDRGARLGTMALDDCYVELRQNLLDNGPIAELSDPANNYGLRLTALTPTIKAMRVVAPETGDFVSIEPQFNFEDPFGREWEKTADTGMVVLAPGQTVQWKVRLELFALSGDSSGL